MSQGYLSIAYGVTKSKAARRIFNNNLETWEKDLLLKILERTQVSEEDGAMRPLYLYFFLKLKPG